MALENIFRNKTLWVTKSDFLNDYTEYLYAIDLVNKAFMKNKYKYLNESVRLHIIKEFKSNLSKSFIFSTSLNSDSINLWGNYSEHEGYNIGFNLREIYNRICDNQIYVTGNGKNKDGFVKKYYITFNSEPIDMYPGKVLYDYDIQVDTIKDILYFLDQISEKYYTILSKDKDEQNTNRYQYNNAFGTAVRILYNQIKLIKNPIFKQDEEYRIIFDIYSKRDVIKYRQFKGVFIPYIEVGFDKSNNIKGLPVDSVTIGPKNNLDIASKGLSQFIKSQGYKITKKPECHNDDKLLIKDSAVPLRY